MTDAAVMGSASTGSGRPQGTLGRGSGDNRRHQGRGHPRRFVPKQAKFEGSCIDLKGHFFDSTGYDCADRFTKTLEQISNYVGREYWHGGTMAKAVEKLTQPTMTMPSTPNGYGTDKVDPTDKYVWEQEVKEAIHDKKEIGKLVKKLYALVMGQCAEAMVAQMSAHKDFKPTSDRMNGIDLLKII